MRLTLLGRLARVHLKRDCIWTQIRPSLGGRISTHADPTSTCRTISWTAHL